MDGKGSMKLLALSLFVMSSLQNMNIKCTYSAAEQKCTLETVSIKDPNDKNEIATHDFLKNKDLTVIVFSGVRGNEVALTKVYKDEEDLEKGPKNDYTFIPIYVKSILEAAEKIYNKDKSNPGVKEVSLADSYSKMRKLSS